MSLIRPLPAWLPIEEFTAEVVTPPLGGLTVGELSELSASSPYSFIRVAAAGIDSAEGGHPDGHPASAANPAAGSARLAEMIVDGIFERIPGRSYFVYEVLSGSHRAVGLVGEVDVAGYTDGRILRHESTRAATEELLVGLLDELRIHADPIALAYKRDRKLETIIERVMVDDPVRHFTTTMSTPGRAAEVRICHQRVWLLDEPTSAVVDACVAEIDRLYITDGHHRMAAAASSKRSLDSGAGVLAVLYSDDALTVLPFDRVVVSDLMPLEIVAGVAADLPDMTRLDLTDVWEPTEPGDVTMVVGGVAYKVRLADTNPQDPVRSLDVSRLQDQILAPVFGIEDPTTDPRLRYIAGEGLRPSRIVPEETAFLLHATTVKAVMDVADAELVMPPKSTWFEPKAWGGLFLRRFED